MASIDSILQSFINGDYFVVFLALVLIILVVLIISLIKSREDYNELLNYTNSKDDSNKNDIKVSNDNDILDDMKSLNEDSLTDDLLNEFEALKATSEEDMFDEDKPLVKQVDLKNVKTYNDIIDEYEYSEEENAVISADELEKRKNMRFNNEDESDNQAAIAKYEEEQEKKAIISYSQLLKNASNISLLYKEEENKDKKAPKINKIEIEQKEVSEAENYLEEEEFLKILKEFRLTL